MDKQEYRTAKTSWTIRTTETRVLMIIEGWIFFAMILVLIVVGLSFARSSQDYIDEQNDRIRQDQKWRDKQ